MPNLRQLIIMLIRICGMEPHPLEDRGRERWDKSVRLKLAIFFSCVANAFVLVFVSVGFMLKNSMEQDLSEVLIPEVRL